MHENERNCVCDLYLFIEYNTSDIYYYHYDVFSYANKSPISDNMYVGDSRMQAFRWHEIIIPHRREPSRVRIRCNLNLCVAKKSRHRYIYFSETPCLRDKAFLTLHLHEIYRREGKVTYGRMCICARMSLSSEGCQHVWLSWSRNTGKQLAQKKNTTDGRCASLKKTLHPPKR